MGRDGPTYVDHQARKPLQLESAFDQLLNCVRERVEGAFDILKEGRRSVEYMLAHTVQGLYTRILAKISCVTLRLYRRRFLGVDILTYTVKA